jgi:glycine/D-amino acid oxidase-like deaminating enzyme
MSFPFARPGPPAFTGPLPGRVDLAVIGGGVAGICTALFAARAGLRVAVFEKGRVAAEQSGRNWGWVRQQGRDLAELPIVTEALRHWEGFAQAIGDRLGFVRAGVTYLAADAATLARFEGWARAAAAFGVETHVLSAREARARVPGYAARIAGGITTPSDGRAEPWAAVPLIAAMAAAEGVIIREGCAVRALDRAGGRIAGVVTEAGRVAADAVLVAAGAWSGLFLRAEGVVIPQLAVRATVARIEGLRLPGGAIAGQGWATRGRADGGHTLAPGGNETHFVGPDSWRHLRWFLPELRRDPFARGLRPAAPRGFPDAWGTPRRWDADRPSPFEAMRVLNPAPDRASIERTARALARAVPGARGRVTDLWAGMIDTMPDVVPVLDSGPVPGLWIATGLSGHGFGIGPGVGRVMADLILGRPPGHDLARFRLGRFAGPVRVDFGAAL